MGKGGSRLQRKEAEAIAKKLEAQIVHGAKHIHANIYHDGILILTFGIRHDKKAGHGHIPKYLKISETEAVKMAKCHISKDEYFQLIKNTGLI